jgi:hypothetical protein
MLAELTTGLEPELEIGLEPEPPPSPPQPGMVAITSHNSIREADKPRRNPDARLTTAFAEEANSKDVTVCRFIMSRETQLAATDASPVPEPGTKNLKLNTLLTATKVRTSQLNQL